MTKRKERREFSVSFKLQVLSDYYSGGGSGNAICRKWEIDRSCLNVWRKQYPIDSKLLSLSSEVIEAYRMEHPDNKELTSEEILQKHISDLERALEYEKMRSRAYEKMIEIAEAEEGISILKKGGAKQ